MRKLLTVIFSIAVLTFCGCVSNNPEAKASTGEPTGKVSTFLQGAYIDVATATSKLEAAGFEIVATNKKVVKQGTTIVFTCPKLKAQGAKPGRAYISAMRLFVDDKEKAIAITNPVYFGKAYMQKEYNHAVFSAIKAKIDGAFPGLKDSVDKMDFDDLADFHFTIGMPYYEDQAVIGTASNAELLAKAKNYKKGKLFVFELKLSETSTLVGYGVGRKTARFVKKIGRANAALMPWMISIENGQAKILKGEYYIAMNYPLLGMGAFMGIASIPDSVIKDLTKPFKK
ncbi:MAG: hypothetical protein L3J19_04530 [Sulfurimonas sp.]|nr:hypothetical protein [Sulfurimonas sp.]